MTTRVELLLIAFCLAFTVSLSVISAGNMRESAEVEFHRLTEDAVQVLATRMQTYLQSLYGAAALLKSTEETTTDDWENYVASLHIDTFLPGISGIGLIVPVQDGDLDRFVSEVRDTENPDFEVRQRTDADEHYIVKLISPQARNEAAVGLDATFEPERRKALEDARDTKTAMLTPPIPLVQHDVAQSGFLLLLPVFEDNGTGAFLGWVYAPFMAQNLLAGLTTYHNVAYQLELFERPSQGEVRPIFSDHDAAGETGSFEIEFLIEQFGRPWTIAFKSTPVFDTSFSSRQPTVIMMIGLLLTIMLVFLLRSLRVKSEAMRELAALRVRQIVAREEEKRSILENAVLPVFMLNEDQRVIFANQAAQACFGLLASEVVGVPFETLVDQRNGEDLPKTQNAVGFTRSGRKLALDLQCNDWTDSEGQKRTTAIVRNLTAEIEAERELKRTKAQYDLALRGSRIGVFDIDLTTGTSEVSETWCQIMGFEGGCNDHDTQREFLSRIHPEDLHILETSDRECIEGVETRSISEYRMRFGQDEWRWMRSDAVIVERDKDGKALRMIGTQTDVTDLNHSRNALEASEQQFRKLFDAAPIGMALMDDNWTFVGVNDAFSQFCNIPKGALGGTMRLSDVLDQDDIKTMYRDVMAIQDGDKGGLYKGEHKFTPTNGQSRWGLFKISWTFDRNRGGNLYIAQVIDITDEKRIARIKDEFVSTVSHELRTPLTSIKGALGLINATNDKNLSAGTRRLLEIAGANTDRLTAIVNDILDLEKISSGELPFDFAEIDLSHVIEDARREMMPFCVTHANTLRVDLPDDDLLVLADASRTKQVLANLISNACKYSFDNTEILVKAERLGDVGIVYVQNVGPGVPENFKPRIFQAFSQADSSDTRAKGGTGLGLNITRQIIRRHGGKIGFESVMDGITVFWFTYPLIKTPETAPLKELRDTRRGGSERPVILHIENDADFADVVGTALEPYAEVTCARTLAEARAKMHLPHLDVVIVDWKLPDRDGEALVDALITLHPDVRIISLSGDDNRNADPRLSKRLVKSWTNLEAVVATVAGMKSKAS